MTLLQCENIVQTRRVKKRGSSDGRPKERKKKCSSSRDLFSVLTMRPILLGCLLVGCLLVVGATEVEELAGEQIHRAVRSPRGRDAVLARGEKCVGSV